jgi:predicted ribosome quality control (RQC) complex YloA/Tae2 family protein
MGSNETVAERSGKCSKQARDAAIKREATKLFPPGFFDKPTLTPEEQAKQKADRLRLSAKKLRDLAARGMNRHKYTREAAKMESQADVLMANACYVEEDK